MQGKRVYPDKDGNLFLNKGEYGYDPAAKRWFACTPDGQMGNLGKHSVIEHDDGTITVSPSILVTSWSAGEWHGYLARGVWRQV
ncbi:MAG: hypothetical protein KC419_17100 [Anaerolineales bacterium]|nr:hypothetical protein [Anaerolineales bacterium]